MKKGKTFKELTNEELEQTVGRGDLYKLVDKGFGTICSFIDGFNGKKYRGKCE